MALSEVKVQPKERKKSPLDTFMTLTGAASNIKDVAGGGKDLMKLFAKARQ